MATQPETVLIVEADASQRERFRTLLLQGGTNPLTAESVAEGLRVALNSPPDIILLGIDTADPRGANTLPEIKELANAAQDAQERGEALH